MRQNTARQQANVDRNTKELYEKQQQINNILRAHSTPVSPEVNQMYANLEAKLRAKGELPPSEEEELFPQSSSLATKLKELARTIPVLTDEELKEIRRNIEPSISTKLKELGGTNPTIEELKRNFANLMMN